MAIADLLQRASAAGTKGVVLVFVDLRAAFDRV